MPGGQVLAAMMLVAMATGTLGTVQYSQVIRSHPPWICDHVCSCQLDGVSLMYSGNCSYRQLKVLPRNLPANFIHLDFSHNLIQSVPAEGFLSLQALQTLDLSANQIDRLSETSFKGLSKLQELWLNDNKLVMRRDQSPFETHIFADLKNLHSLHINNNTLSCAGSSCGYPDKALAELTNLQNLFMDGLPNQNLGPGFRNLTHLHTLILGNENGNCYMPTIFNETFTSLTHTNLTSLAIRHCDITTIEPEAFRPLTKIQTLDLAWHSLTFANLKTGLTGLSNSPIKVLRLVHLQTPGFEFVLPERTFESLVHTNLTDIIFRQNSVARIGANFIKFLPKSLENLDVSSNFIAVGRQDWLFLIAELVNLKSFNGSHQANGFDRPISVRKQAKVQSFFPLFIDLENKTQNVIHDDRTDKAKKPDVFLAPRNLQNIYMQNSNLNLGSIPPLNFTSNSLLYADFSGNRLKIKGPLYGLHKLKYLKFSDVQSHELHSDFFSDMPNLEEVYLQGNTLNCLSKDVQGQTFSAVGKLKKLDLSRNGIGMLPPTIFKRLYKLESLILNTNYLLHWQVKVGHMVNLTLLDLRRNRLSTLDSSARQDLDMALQNPTLRINLFGNPLECLCNNIEFLKWVNERQASFTQLDSYSCQLPDKTKTSLRNLPALIRKLELQCMSDTVLIVSSVCLTGMLITITLIACIYRQRWRVRYIKNRLALRLKLYQPLLDEEEEGEGNVSYDAFLSYEEQQHQFIVNTIYPDLERQRGLKLCIHTRDFTPGTAIAMNIYRAVHYSKKTVAFLTAAYFDSDWCVYELEMAYLESVHTGRQLLLPVLMEQLDMSKLPRDKQKIFQSLTYLDYTNMDQGEFCNKLAESIRRSESDVDC